MSDYVFYLDSAREAAALVSRLEEVFSRNPSDRAMRLTLRSAQRMAERTERELYEVARHDQVDVIRYRLVKPREQRFALEGVSKSLELFQEAVSYIYQAISGHPRMRASMSKADKRDSELLFGYSYAGSLGIVLLVPGQQDLFRNKLDDVVQTIQGVFDIVSNDELRDTAKKIGRAAVRKIYEWSEANYEAGYDLDLRWTSANALETGRYLETRQFGSLANMISITSEVEKTTLRRSGTLVGFDAVLRRFHLVEPDGDSFKGALADGFPTHRDWTINHRYDAVMVSETTTKFATGEESTQLRLSSLESA